MAPNLAIPNEGLVPVEALDTLLAKISAAHGAQFRSAIEALCVVRTCQVVVNFQNNRVLTAWDYEHLTEGGSINLVNMLFDSN